MSGLRRALVGLAIAAFALGLAALALVTTSDREGDSAAWIALALTLGWSFCGAGIYAWWRRPENRTGTLMTLVGFIWFLGALNSADAAWAYTIGLLLGSLWIAALVHMLVAFPTGRVEPGLERAVVIAGWTASIVAPLLGDARHRATRTTATTARPICCSSGTARRRRTCRRAGRARVRRPARRPGRRADPALARLRQGAAARAVAGRLDRRRCRGPRRGSPSSRPGSAPTPSPRPSTPC